MGYTTTFQGALKFTNELSTSELGYLNSILGEDVREHKEWQKYPSAKELNYLDLELTKKFDGIQWDGAEKSYEMVDQVNFIIDIMKDKKSNFGLTGTMDAQGEDVEDRWKLTIQNNKAIRIENPPKGKKIKCPHCDETFYYEC